MASMYERLEAVGVGAIIVLGLALLFVPEPSTSAIGAAMVVIGLGMWISQWRKMKMGKAVEPEERAAEARAQD